MPRLTTSDYLRNRAILAYYLVLFGGSLFKLLTAQEQWDLHAYYVPTLDWRKDKLLGHRRTISRTRPSLPQRAGRAVQKIKRGAGVPQS